ncbi:NUDIX hydrolase [Tunicatimonas pelagia]|uniref:NUDIX hydrolase n=1 Tax=Tunicatimonas pelagia TaxID=931531 RepID=UPI0026651AE2|nr:NUDIX hydrolase [Tunicatimonas pelagia]WKN45977.1 NUDIX hydrolase [Tunicatimonas pelagia]
MNYPQNIKVTVDAVVFTDDHQEVLLIQRKNDPFQGQWALPGGFVEDDEDLDTAVARELEEETGVDTDKFYQVHTFGKPDRDPRGRAISVAYYTIVRKEDFQPKAATDAKDVRWFSLENLPTLAFDHATILQQARKALNQYPYK